MILEKLEERDIPSPLKNFLRDILIFERGKLDQDNPHYTAKYKNLLNKHVEQSQEDSN
jgi:hypothetical protein